MTRTDPPTAVRAVARAERGWLRTRRAFSYEVEYDDGRVEHLEELTGHGFDRVDVMRSDANAREACPGTGPGEWVAWG
jgi:hypothetical protein